MSRLVHVAVLLVFCVIVRGDQYISKSKSVVIDLNDASFEAQVGKPGDGVWFIKFYSPKCIHCKRLAPTWDTLAARLKGRTRVARLDCTANRATCGKLDQVKGFPTLLLFRDDAPPIKYDGARKVDAFEAFLAEHDAIGEAVEEEADEEDEDVMPGDIDDTFFNAMVSVAVLSVGFVYLFGVPCTGASAPAPRPVRRARAEDSAASAGGGTNGELVHIGDAQEFAAFLEKHRLVVVKFEAEWCGPCKRIVPDVLRLAERSAPKGVAWAAVDVDKVKSVADEYQVRSMPTFLFIKHGEVHGRLQGADVNRLRGDLQRHGML